MGHTEKALAELEKVFSKREAHGFASSTRGGLQPDGSVTYLKTRESLFCALFGLEAMLNILKKYPRANRNKLAKKLFELRTRIGLKINL